MKESFGRKFLAGVISASMILGIPFAGYAQEEDTELVLTAEASDETMQISLAGAEASEEVYEAEEQSALEEEIPEEAASFEDASAFEEEETVVAEAADETDPEEAFEVIEADDEDELMPEDGFLIEDEEEDEILEAADAVTVPVGSEDELKTAIKQASDGTILQLTGNISVIGSVYMDDANMLPSAKAVTIDLHSYSLTIPAASSLFVRTGKSLTLKDGTVSGRLMVQGGSLTIPAGVNLVGDTCLVIDKEEGKTTGGSVSLTGGTITSSTGSGTRVIEMNAGTLKISGGSIKSSKSGCDGILMPQDSTGAVTMSGGNIETARDGVVIENGSFTMTGGTISVSGTGGDAIEVRRKGRVSVSGSKISGTKFTTTLESASGFAINDYYKAGDPANSDSDSSIAVSGGFFSGSTQEFSSNDKTKIVRVKTSAVGFANEVEREFLPSVNCRTEKNSDGIYVIRELTASNAAAAYIRDGETFYTESLQEAMNVLASKTYSPKSGDVVKLCKDIVDEETVTVPIARTIDLNGHTLKTELTVEGCAVTLKNAGKAGSLQAYSNGYALVVGEEANVTLDASLTVSSGGYSAVKVGGTDGKNYRLTAKNTITAKDNAIYIDKGNSTVQVTSAKLTSTGTDAQSALRVASGAAGAKVTVTNSTLTGPIGIYAEAGELTLSGSNVNSSGDQKGDPTPGSDPNGAAVYAGSVKLTIKSGNYTSAKGDALYLVSLKSGSEISGGKFKSGRSTWDAVSGTGALTPGMITGGAYYPNTKNFMATGVDTASKALVGLRSGTFYVEDYSKVMPALYAANPSAVNLSVGAAAEGKVITGFKAHATILNKTGKDISLLIGTDTKVAKNAGTLPKTAETTPWVFHNDLVKLSASSNKAATCTLPGVKADCWYCEALKKAYKDADAKEEDATLISQAALGHTWGAYDAKGYRTCSVCGEKEYDASKVQPAYQISGKPASVKAKAAGSRKLTVSWKKASKSKLKKIKGYYIEVSTDKAFTNIVKTKKVKKSKTSYTFKSLKKGQKYYVRVRYYKGSKISKWSSVKNKKVR